MTAFAEIEDLYGGYGNAEVLFGLNMRMEEGEVTTLMGRNGMGKTTTVRCLMGMLKPQKGRVLIRDRDMTGSAPFDVAQAGVGLVPEGRHVFPSLTVSENLIATSRSGNGAWTEARIYDAFPRLAERKGHYGFQLSGGEQQMLAIGRALMTNPDLLILDEATEGLAPLIRAEIWNLLHHLKSTGLSILLIDKNLAELSRVSDKFYVIDKGRIVWNGTADALQSNRAQVENHLHI